MRTLAVCSILLSGGCTLYFEENLGGGAADATAAAPSIEQAFGALRWAVTIGGVEKDGYTRVAVAPNGDVAAAGTIQGVVDFGGMVVDTGEHSGCFVVLLDGADGSPRWSVAPTGYTCNVSDTAIDGEGNVLVTGSYGGAVDFGGQALENVAMAQEDMFIASYAPDGELRWVHGLAPTSGAYSRSVAVAPNGDVFVAGYYYGTSDVGAPHDPPDGGSEAFIVSFDRAGDYRWGRSFVAAGYQVMSSISVAGGELVVSGQISDDTSVGGDVLVANANMRPFLARYSVDGAHLWSRVFGIDGPGASTASIHAVRDDGTIVVVGEQSAINQFPDETVVRAFGADGTEAWSVGSLDRVRLHAVAIAPSGATLIGGSVDTITPMTFGPSTLADGMLLLAHDSAGVPIEGRAYAGGGVADDLVTGMATSPDGAIVMAGYFSGAVDLGAGAVPSVGDADVVIAVFNSPGD